MPALTELQGNYDDAVSAYNAAIAAETAARLSMNNAYAAIGRCVDGKGNGRPLEASELPAIGAKVNLQGCQDPKGFTSCKTDCCSKKTCEERGSSYNTTVDNYNNSKSKVAGAKAKMDAARAALQSDPGYQASQQEEIEKGKTTRVLIIIGGITILVIIIGYVVLKYVLKKI